MSLVVRGLRICACFRCILNDSLIQMTHSLTKVTLRMSPFLALWLPRSSALALDLDIKLYIHFSCLTLRRLLVAVSFWLYRPTWTPVMQALTPPSRRLKLSQKGPCTRLTSSGSSSKSMKTFELFRI